MVHKSELYCSVIKNKKNKSMNQEQVLELMRSSKNETEWNANFDKVKSACGGYPDFWFSSIILSGLLKQVSAKWGGDDQIHAYALNEDGTETKIF